MALIHSPFCLKVKGHTLAQQRSTVPDAKVHRLCGPDHPNGEQHIVTDFSCLQGCEQRKELEMIIIAYSLQQNSLLYNTLW